MYSQEEWIEFGKDLSTTVGRTPSALGKQKEFVLPGQRIGVIEEFIPRDGTYVDDGTIYSAASGLTMPDVRGKTIRVESNEGRPRVPKVGSTVIGEVTAIQERSLTLRIHRVEEESISGYFTGLLHVSDVSDNYVRNMTDAFQAGDVVRARVISTTNARFHLTTNEPELGVVYSSCDRCGATLVLRRGSLGCQSCGNRARKKLASDYGRAKI